MSNEKILHNLMLADRHETKIILRCIMVKSINMDEEHFNTIAGLVSRLSHCAGVELLPYHTFGGSKNEQLGYRDNGRKDWIPTSKDLKAVTEKLEALGVTIIQNNHPLTIP